MIFINFFNLFLFIRYILVDDKKILCYYFNANFSSNIIFNESDRVFGVRFATPSDRGRESQKNYIQESKKMKKNKVLLGAVAAIALCVCMLVGATYAWLTDEVVSGTNVVKSGSLTVGVEYTLDGENWADLNGADDLFENAVWEPGYTKVIALRVTNKGNVALKFGWGINYVGETKGVNKASEEYSLSKYLECAYSAMQEWDEDNVIAQIYLQIAFDRDGQKAIGWTKTSFEEMCAMQQGGSTLAPGQQVIGMMKIYMPETLGNEVNARTPEEAAEIKMGIAVVATQAPVESDGFDNKYDEGRASSQHKNRFFRRRNRRRSYRRYRCNQRCAYQRRYV